MENLKEKVEDSMRLIDEGKEDIMNKSSQFLQDYLTLSLSQDASTLLLSYPQKLL